MFNRSFLENVALGAYTNIVPFVKYGYNPTLAAVESDIWGLTGLYGVGGLFPQAAVQMEIVGSENTNDIGTIIKGSRSTPITSDAGGSLTTLLDADVDFGAATAVEVGDYLILDPSGPVAEWGVVTTVAAHTLTCSAGFSVGGTGTTRVYFVIDANAHTGAEAFRIEYLDNTFVSKSLILPANGTTAVTTLNSAGAALTDLYRINTFRMIASGSLYKTSGYWEIRTVSAGTIWDYITLGNTRARAGVYTVPANKTLYINNIYVGWASPNDNKIQSARFIVRINAEPSLLFNTGNIFYPIIEPIITNSTDDIEYKAPLKVPQKTDLRTMGVAYTGGSGPATSAIRGFIVS